MVFCGDDHWGIGKGDDTVDGMGLLGMIGFGGMYCDRECLLL